MSTDFGEEKGWWNRCSLSSSLYSYGTDHAPAFRTVTEKFQMQARSAAIQLGFSDEEADLFFDTVVSVAKRFDTLNGAALALVFSGCFTGAKLDMKKTQIFFHKLSLLKQPDKFMTTYGITAKDLVRYVRFCADNM